jgi:tetratricopeptide (TPR) repeat protein
VRIHPRAFLLRDALRRAKGWEKVLQHVERCAKCRERAFLLRSPQGRTATPDYGPAIERSFRRFEALSAALGKERSEAPGLLSRLIRLPKGQQQLLIRNSSRYQTWGLFELLIQVGREETFTDPAHAEELLELALDVSGCLDDSFYGKERIEDLRARAWGYIGNARRVNRDLSAAEEIFGEASQRLRKGTEDPLERATHLDLKASLQRDQENCEGSLQCSRRAIAILSRVGETHLVGRALLNLSITYRAARNTKAAFSALKRSLDLVEPAREPRLMLCSVHNLIEYLVSGRRLMEAQGLMARSLQLYQRFREPKVEGHRQWIEARILTGLGRHREAEKLLAGALGGFTKAGASYEHDLAANDLASVRAAVR